MRIILNIGRTDYPNGPNYSTHGIRNQGRFLKLLLKIEEREKFLGLDEVTLVSLEAELSPDIVEQAKNEVKIDIENGYLCYL